MRRAVRVGPASARREHYGYIFIITNDPPKEMRVWLSCTVPRFGTRFARYMLLRVD